ncbi:MAG: glucokinase [Thermodesulfobacteriota bacterium]
MPEQPAPIKYVLAGDVGGTKTNLGLFQLKGDRPEAIAVKSYPSSEYGGLEEVVLQFLHDQHQTVDSACFGIAGPVQKGVSRVTNLPWKVSEEGIRERCGIAKAVLINDLAATANAIPILRESELENLNKRPAEPDGSIGLVAPGTGLGIGLLVFREGQPTVIPSEGGHVDFAPKNEVEIDLLRYLLRRMPRVSVERVASGPGLHTIFSWLKEYRQYQEPDWLTERLQEEDPAKVISEAALGENDPVCSEALDIFVSIIGAISGNLALTALTTGGLYLGGGIAPKIITRLRDGTFMEAFAAKGRFRDMLCDMPVRVILNDQAALLGAAWCAFQD